MKENDILVFRDIMENIKKEISEGVIRYSKKEERFVIHGEEYQMSRLQQWILKHVKSKEVIEKINRLFNGIKMKKIKVGHTDFIHVYIEGKVNDYLLLETFI